MLFYGWLLIMVSYTDFSEYYDFDHDMTFDIGFYLEYAADFGSPILELGCGTGRVLVPLVKAGFEVYGVDISENMLEICQESVLEYSQEGHVHLIRADMAAFDLPRKDFGVVFIALRSFMHLLTKREQLACLEQVHQHLRPNGCLIIDVIAPDLKKLGQERNGEFVVRREFDLPNGNHVVRSNRLVEHDASRQVRQFEFKFEESDMEGALVGTKIVPVFTRYIFWDEMVSMMEGVGFEVVDIFRDFDRNPYDGTGEMIMVARRP